MHSSILTAHLFFSSRWLAYLTSRPSICGKLCCCARLTAWSHWLSRTQQSMAALLSPACRIHAEGQATSFNQEDRVKGDAQRASTVPFW